MAKLSYKWRTVLPVALILLIGFSLMIIYIGVSTNNTLTTISVDWITTSATRLADYTNIEISNMLASVRSLTPVLEKAILQQNADRTVLVNMMKNVAQQNTSMKNLYIYLEPNVLDGRDAEFRNIDYHDSTGIFSPFVGYDNGKYVLRTFPLDEHQRFPYYQMVRASQTEIMTQPYLDESWMVTTAVPIIINGRNVGFIGADYDFASLNNYLSSFKVLDSDNRFAEIIGANGDIAATTMTASLGSNALSLMESGTSQELSSLISGKKTGVFTGDTRRLDGSSYIGSSTFTVGNTGSYLTALVAVSQKVAYEKIIAGRIITTALGTTVLLATVFILYHISNGASKSIIVLNGQLVNTSAAVLTASMQIADSSDILAQGGVQQAASIEETSATMNQAAQMAQNNAENTHKALDLSGEASRSAEQGHHLVTQLISSMEELSRSSDEIGRIIKIIDDIAFQTNILALNAAVEAARAGDEGRGFAVVAAEVGNLAQKSAEAAKNTASIIERNLELSRRGVDSSIEVGASLGNISAKNSEVNQLMQQISTSSNEQSRAAEQINIALSQMEDVTQSNAAVAEESSAASSELKTQATELDQLTQDLTQLILGNTSGHISTVKQPTAKRRSEVMPEQPRQAPPRQLPGSGSAPFHQAPPRSRIVSPNEVIPLEKDNRF